MITIKSKPTKPYFAIVICYFILISTTFAQSETQIEIERLSREKVQSLNFSGNKEVSDLLITLPTYPNLLNLDVSNSYIQNKDLVLIKNEKLISLNLTNTLINSEAISFIAQLPNLKNLYMEGTFINNASMPLIARLHWLDKLVIGRTHVTDNGILALKNSKISFLDLTSLRITDEGMKYISTMENLRELYLWNVKIVSKGLDNLHNLKKLQVLALGGSDINNEGLRSISKCPNLKIVNLSLTKITDVGLEFLIGNKSIEVLSLSGTQITSNGIKSLSKMKKLKILTLEDVLLQKGDDDLLAEIPHLKALYINNGTVKEKMVNAIVKKLPWSAVYYEGYLRFAVD